mmetsp:Transcript_1843/g.4293  ORF Transcript_1843/g.4293 Transcript_1843/m.4293 type:complete len:209 (-) Transcript_1843:1418-2044(-)
MLVHSRDVRGGKVTTTGRLRSRARLIDVLLRFHKPPLLVFEEVHVLHQLFGIGNILLSLGELRGRDVDPSKELIEAILRLRYSGLLLLGNESPPRRDAFERRVFLQCVVGVTHMLNVLGRSYLQVVELCCRVCESVDTLLSLDNPVEHIRNQRSHLALRQILSELSQLASTFIGAFEVCLELWQGDLCSFLTEASYFCEFVPHEGLCL